MRSKTFAPLLEATRLSEEQNRSRSKRRKIDGHSAFKIGHGGTLDPMATGVLIVGIGRGTKSLQNFLDGTKTYETVVLFGKSTDTYDIAGRIVANSDPTDITRAMVEEKLQAFRGEIQQAPPIYSALKIDGMKAYDYARLGKELPRQLASRKMTVSECTLVEWFSTGEHDYRWPAEEVSSEDKEVLEEVIDSSESKDLDHELKKSPSAAGVNAPSAKLEDAKTEIRKKSLSVEEKAKMHTHEIVGLEEKPANAPAVRIRLTVSSGFYVRSFAHDLGIACGSYGIMAELARSKQAYFSTSVPAPNKLVSTIDHADLAKGEDVWGPKIRNVLEEWIANNPVPQQQHFSAPRRSNFHAQRTSHDRRKRRNSSSPERN